MAVKKVLKPRRPVVRTAAASSAFVSPANEAVPVTRVVKVSVDVKGATHIALSVRQFDPATRALIPPELTIALVGNKGVFQAEVGRIYAVKYYFLGNKKASIELSAKTDAQKPADDPIAKLAHAKTVITSDLGFNLGYWQVPTKGEIQ